MIEKDAWACIHNEESKIECESTYDQVKKEIAVEKDFFVSALMHACEAPFADREKEDREWGKYRFELRGIATDQWHGVYFFIQWYDESIDKYGKFVDVGKVAVQCDIVEHGLARAYLLCKEVAEEHKQTQEKSNEQST